MDWQKIIRFLHLWQYDWIENQELRPELKTRNLKTTLSRCITFSYLFAILHFLYGFSSIQYIHLFDPSVSLFYNVLWRLLFASTPLIALALLLKRWNASDLIKVHVWMLSFAVVFHAACWIYVWPIVLHGHPEILPYANSANVFSLAIVPIILMLPNMLLLAYFFYISVIFIIPLILVLIKAGGMVILMNVINDYVLALMGVLIVTSSINRLRSGVASIERTKNKFQELFMHPMLRKDLSHKDENAYLADPIRFLKSHDINAMDANKKLQKKVLSVVLNIDIRGFTELRKKLTNMDAIQLDFQAILAKNVQANWGTLQKAMGDGYIAYFADINQETSLDDLADLPEMAHRKEEGDQQRLAQLVRNACSAFNDFYAEINQYFLSMGVEINLGAAVDLGPLEFRLASKGDMKEVEFFGEVIIRSDRLQKFTKKIMQKDGHSSTILVVSPWAKAVMAEDNKEKTQLNLYKLDSDKVDNYHEIDTIFIKRY